MKIDCIIITYNPNINKLNAVIKSLRNQIRNIYLVDNGSDNIAEIIKLKTDNVIVKILNSNLGIAKATNIGFELAKDSDYILLSDHDTIYPDNYIDEFDKSRDVLVDSNIAAFAPAIYDEITGKEKPVYDLQNQRIKKNVPNESRYIFQTIASGLVINTKILKKIGGMREDLFIDYVDFEWCWKVQSKGYNIFYNKKMIISHRLGDENLKIGKKQVSLRSYIRYYYIIRNAIYLSLDTEYLSKKTKFFVFLDGIKYFFGYQVLSHFSPKAMKLIFKGLLHGLFGKLGKLE